MARHISLVLILAACGDPLTATLSGSGALTLSVCRNEDPVPNAQDDERSLCAGFILTELTQGTFTIDGTTSYGDASNVATRTFQPAAGHASAVLAAWGSGACFSAPLTSPLTQTVRGRLQLGSISGAGASGTVDLEITGALAEHDCGWALPARVTGAFSTRP